MKFFTPIISAIIFWSTQLNAQQLEIKCGTNTITIDSATKVQRSFFECDSIRFRVTNLQGEYTLKIVRISKQDYPRYIKGGGNNKNGYLLSNGFITQNYDKVRTLVINVSQNEKYVKSYKLLLNYSVDSYK